MSVAGKIWAPAALRFLRVGIIKTTKMIRTKLASAARPIAPGEFAHIPIRTKPTGRQPIHPAALLRQKRAGRWYSTTQQNVHNTVRRWISTAGGSGSSNVTPRLNRASFPTSNTSRRVGQNTGRAPFASTLRPNLTGGAIPRTQGGYSTGGGARYFSHTPAAPAQVVHNVSVAMRAFCLSGKKARYDGLNTRGEMCYRAVSELEQAAYGKMMGAARGHPGAFIDFKLDPTITALSSLGPAAAAGFTFPGATLHEEGFLDVLSVDFARAVKDLAVIFADLKRIVLLGDLPVTMVKESVLRVRFPGVDAETVERLCDDYGVQRGVVGQDADFEVENGVPIALRFPFAPDVDIAKTITSPGGSLRSLSGLDIDIDEAFINEMEDNSWVPDLEGYESMSPRSKNSEHASDDYEGLEGIHRFLEECDRAKGRY